MKCKCITVLIGACKQYQGGLMNESLGLVV